MAEHMHTNPIELQRLAREKLIAYRSKEETRFNNWKKALLTCGKEEVLDKLPFDVNEISLEGWIPELYKDRPDPDKYKKQLQQANTLIEQVNSIMDELNRKGAVLLEEYNSIK